MKILLVDDEILVRTKVKYILEVGLPEVSLETAFTLCGEAANGLEALELIEKLRPDIIISDMKMPIMDGLELSRCCKEKYPDMIFIALSNFDDFEYVKGTLLNGASDYLLKHKLDAKYLSETLAKAVKEKKKKTSSGEIPVRNMDSLKSDFLISLLTGICSDQELAARRIASLNLNLTMTQVVPVLMWVHEYSESNLQENNIRSFSIINIITEIMTEQKNGAICHLGDGKYLLVLGFEGIKSERRIREELTFVLNRIRFCMKNFLELDVYYIVGMLLDSLLDIQKEYGKLEKQYRKNFYIEKDIWTSAEKETDGSEDTKNIYDSQTEKELMLALLNDDKEQVYLLLETIFRRINEKKPAEVIFKMILTRMLDSIEKAAEESGLHMERVYQDSFSQEEILLMKSFQSVQTAMLGLINTFFLVKKTQNRKEISPYVQKAVSYIYQHYKENLSQTQVAEHTGISNVYLSLLFKKELGETFPAFLMNVRLAHAEYSLKNGKRNLKEIADECGFIDYTYFLKSFKKKYGCTPKEYRKNRK